MSTGIMNIPLPGALRAFVAERVESGEYGNTSEYVRELTRKDQRKQRVRRLLALVENGLTSGPATADTHDDWAERNAIADGRGRLSRQTAAIQMISELGGGWDATRLASR